LRHLIDDMEINRARENISEN